MPFPYKTSGQKLKAHLKKRATPVQSLREGIPKQVAAIVAKMMAKRAENRIQTAEEVIRYLRPYVERQETAFNFRSVLNARTVHAKKRLDAKKQAQPTTRDSDAVSLSDAVKPPETEPRQSTIETIVREETMLDQKEIRRKKD